MSERYGIRVDKQYFNFCSAHFLIFEDGTREELHGHNYHVSIDVEGELNAGQLVLDFIPFKPVVKAICDELDHRTILAGENPALEIRTEGSTIFARFGEDQFAFPARDTLVLPLPNTSTECLARHIALRLKDEIISRFPESSVGTLKVSVSESPGQAGWFATSVR